MRKAMRSVHGSCERGRLLQTGLSSCSLKRRRLCRCAVHGWSAGLLCLYPAAAGMAERPAPLMACRQCSGAPRTAGHKATVVQWTAICSASASVAGQVSCKLPSMLARVQFAPCHACWTGTAPRLAEAAGDMCCMLCRPHLQHSLRILSSLQQQERRHCICLSLSSDSVTANNAGSSSSASRPRLQLCTA